MNYFSRLFLISLFMIPVSLFSQVDSITITHHWELFDGDSTIDNIVDSFSTGTHVGEYVYDVNNNPVRRTNYIWAQQGLIDSTIEKFTTGTWIYFHRTNNQFYPNDSLHISTKYYYIFNYISGTFDTNGTRITITFDSITNSKIILQEEMNYNSPWSIARRDNYTYDPQHRLTYYLAEFGTNLQPSNDKYIHYLPNDSIDYYFYRTYQSGAVYDTDSVAHLYNSHGFLEEITTFNIWNINLSRPYEMRRFTFDANDNALSSCNHLWDSAIGWYCFPDTTWSTYNSYNQIIETESSYDGGGGNHAWHFYDGSNRLDSAHWITWPHGGDTHYWYYKMEYPLLSSVKTIGAGKNLQLYPNPSNDKITLDKNYAGKHAEIFNSSGKKVIEVLISGNGEIDVHELEAGNYYVKFVSMKTSSFKFIKLQ